MNLQLFNAENVSKPMMLFASLAYVAAMVILMSRANVLVHFIHKQKTIMAVPWAYIWNKRVFPFHKYRQNHHRKPAKQNYLHTFTFSDQLTSSFRIPFNFKTILLEHHPPYTTSSPLFTSCKLTPLHIHHVKTKTYGQHSFSYCVQRQRNSLPSDVSQTESSHDFKTALKLIKAPLHQTIQILSHFPHPPTSVSLCVCMCMVCKK